jgi:hypothetical protein
MGNHKMKKLLIAPIASLTLAIAPIAQATITAQVEPYNSICQAGYPCQVGAIHSIRIINDTMQEQTYNWFFSVQADNGDVVHKQGVITLQSGQEWREDKIANIGYMKFNMRGRKILKCTTQADGYEHAQDQKTGWADVS